jgi:HK97 family phage major capsid protein
MNDMSKKPKTTPGDEARKNDGMQYREAAFEIRAGEGEGAEQTVSMSISSEAPVLTYAYYGGEYQRVWEILDHAPSSIDMSRCKDGLVILDRHYGDQIGLMAVKIEDRKLGGTVEFCTGERAQEIKQDAVRKLRRNTSVGYRVDASKYRLEGDKGGIPVVRAMSWMPYEASFEPVPADPGVGVGRAMSEEEETNPAGQPGKEIQMDPKEMAALFSRGAKFGVTAEEVQKILDDGKGRAELDALIVEKQAADAEASRKEIETLKARKPEQPAAVSGAVPAAPAIVGKERKYSLANVCRFLAGEQVEIGFEREMSQECGRIRGKAPKGMIIPFNALSRRDLSVSGTSSATVATLLDSSNFIDLLRTKYVIGQAGVTFLPGIVGNLSIPKMSAGATAYHVAEGSDVTESTPTLANVTGSPHTIGAIVDVTRRMLEQSTPAVESMIRREIEERLMRGVQIAVFAGTGSDGQPSAITTATGINNPSISSAGTPTYAELLNFPGSIMADNAEAGGQKWIGTAEVWAKLAATATNGAGSALALDVNSNKLIGRDFITTEDLPENSLWFGDWSTVVIPFWGAGVEIAADSAKLFASGGLTLRALLDYDVMVRNGAALAYNTAVTA